MARSVLHVDLDAFFASVEQLDDPALRGKPVLVGGTGRRGVVTAASYEARVFGCRSAMPSATARKLCPHAIFVRGRFHRYRELSEQVFTILARFTPLVEPLSIDEAFLDVTGSERLLGTPEQIARDIRHAVHDETGLTISVGVAPNKFLAKLASDLNKPDGLTIIPFERIADIVWPLPVSRMWGVGPTAERRLHRLGVRTIGDLVALPPEALTTALGSWGARTAELARGEDSRPVTPDHRARSIGHERTFGENIGNPDTLRAILVGQVEDVSARLRRAQRLARTVTIKLRFGDFETHTRSGTLEQRTDRTSAIWREADRLFRGWADHRFRPLRLLGVSVTGLAEGRLPVQEGLFEQGLASREAGLDEVADRINERFGRGAVRRARGLEGPETHKGGIGS